MTINLAGLPAEKQKEIRNALKIKGRQRPTYKTSEYEYDTETGEVKHEHISQTYRQSTEPDFVKVYYKIFLAFCDVNDVPVEFLLALCDYITYANSDGKGQIFSNKLMKSQIGAKLCIKTSMVEKYLKRCKDNGILIPIGDLRGVYEVNPYFIAKGSWQDIKKLQANFDFVSGRWQTRLTLEDKERNKTEISVSGGQV